MDKIDQVPALKAVAEYSRLNADFFVAIVPQVLNAEVRERNIQNIKVLANELDKLAELVVTETVSYKQVDAILREMQKYGFWPDSKLVMKVAKAFNSCE